MAAVFELNEVLALSRDCRAKALAALDISSARDGALSSAIEAVARGSIALATTVTAEGVRAV